MRKVLTGAAIGLAAYLAIGTYTLWRMWNLVTEEESVEELTKAMIITTEHDSQLIETVKKGDTYTYRVMDLLQEQTLYLGSGDSELAAIDNAFTRAKGRTP